MTAPIVKVNSNINIRIGIGHRYLFFYVKGV